jgi:integrase
MTLPQVQSKQQMLDVYANHLSSKGSSRHQYLKHAREFLDYADGEFTREIIDGFMDNMRESRGYNEDTVSHVFSIIRTLLKRNDIDWPYNRGEAPSARESEINAPALDPETVREEIEAVIASDNMAAVAMMALSTTYGLRRSELAGITGDDINLKDKTIYIATLKHGAEKTHIIPDRILPYLELYDFNISRPIFFMVSLSRDIEDMIHFKHVAHVGWHSIRRTVDKLLLDEFKDPVLVRKFMGWNLGRSNDMVERYSSTKFVGKSGESIKVTSDTLDVDGKIFGLNKDGQYRHPFLSSWI